MEEVSYGIPNGYHAEIEDDKVVIKKGDKKSFWSEEDEKMYAATIFALAGFMGNEDKLDWLKSIKDKYTWNPSKEQMDTLLDAIVYVEGCNSNFKDSGSVLENLYNELKKLKG